MTETGLHRKMGQQCVSQDGVGGCGSDGGGGVASGKYWEEFCCEGTPRKKEESPQVVDGTLKSFHVLAHIFFS